VNERVGSLDSICYEVVCWHLCHVLILISDVLLIVTETMCNDCCIVELSDETLKAQPCC